MAQIINSPFAPRKRVYDSYPVGEEDIVEYERYDALVSSDPDNPANFVTVEKVREKSRVNRKEFIQQFSEEVGIQNILKKVALSGDVSHLNQIKRAPLPIDQTDANKREIIQDVSPLQGEAGASSVGDAALKIYGSLPKDLVNGRSFAEFCQTVTQDEILNYYNNKKGVVNNNE